MRALETDSQIANSVYGRLTVVWRSHSIEKSGVAVWFCWCSCGTALYTPLSALRSGRTHSCGCASRERTANLKRSHGRAETREYHIWCGMKARCLNPKNRVYPNYGGRGIRVCERWLNSFENFLADVGTPPNDGQKYSIDRINTNGNYEPGNVRWATQETQANNTRANVFLTAFGKTQTINQWSRETGIHRRLISARVAAGWPHERAVSEKPQRGPRGPLGPRRKPAPVEEPHDWCI